MKQYTFLFAIYSVTAISCAQEAQAAVQWKQGHLAVFPIRSSRYAAFWEAERKLPESAYIQLKGPNNGTAKALQFVREFFHKRIYRIICPAEEPKWTCRRQKGLISGGGISPYQDIINHE